jgi:hypothetical protein
VITSELFTSKILHTFETMQNVPTQLHYKVIKHVNIISCLQALPVMRLLYWELGSTHKCHPHSIAMTLMGVMYLIHTWKNLRSSIQKFPDWADNKIYAYNNKHSVRSNIKGYDGKPTILTHKIAKELHLVAESYDICSFRSRRPVRKLLDTPSYNDFMLCLRT